MALQLAVKAMNETMRPDGVAPSYLVFGWIPRFPEVESTLPNQKDRHNAFERARNEMATVVAELRLKTALASRILQNADLSVAAGDSVRVLRETDKRYVGPFQIIRVHSNQVFFLQGNREVQFDIQQVLPAAEYDDIVNGQKLMDTLQSALSVLVLLTKAESDDIGNPLQIF